MIGYKMQSVSVLPICDISEMTVCVSLGVLRMCVCQGLGEGTYHNA